MLHDLRYALRTLRANPAVRRDGPALAGARYRRQYGDLQLHGRDPGADAARPRPAIAGGDAVAREGAGGRRAEYQRVDVEGRQLGSVSPNLPWAAFEISARTTRSSRVVAFNERLRDYGAHPRAGTHSMGITCPGGFFALLGTPPAAGRLIGIEDDREGAPPVAVVSYGFAQRRFGSRGRRSAQTAIVNDMPFTIVGVAPPGFNGISPGAATRPVPADAGEMLIERIYARTRGEVHRSEVFLGARSWPAASRA